MHDDAGTNVVWSGVFDWGDWEAAKAEADRIVTIKELHFHRFSSTPLECSGRARRVREARPGSGRSTATTRCPASARSGWRPRSAPGSTSSASSPSDIGGGFGNKICLHPYYVTLCLLSRKLNRPVNWTEWRTDQHTANAHGNERWFHDVEVAVKDDGTMLGFNVKALDDCGAFPRYEPLGCIIWAQVTPGCYAWRNIRVDFTQVTTNKSPVSPNRGYSRMQHLWLTERICDIVGAELGIDPVEMRKRNYVKTEQMPYETPNGCVYDSGDYARCLDIALELIGYDTIEERRAEAATRGKLLGVGIGSTLDSGTNNFGQSTAAQPGAPVLGQQRGGDGEARHLRRGRGHARDGAAGAGPRDDGVAGRRRHPRLLARPGARPARPRHASSTRTPASRARTRASSPSPGSAPSRARPSALRAEMITLAAAVLQCDGGGDRARRRLRADQGRPARGGAAVHGARRDREREQRLPAARLQPDAEPPLRLPAVLRHGRHGEEDREADADLRDADPRVRGRGRPGDRRRRDRRLRRRRRLRHADPPADRRGPGARRDRARDRRRALRGLRLRRGRAAADLELLRLPRAARARRAVAEDRRDRVAVPVLAARLEGDGRGRRRRDPLHRLGDPGRAAGRPARRSSTTAATPTTASGRCCRTRSRRARTSRSCRHEGRGDEGAERAARRRLAGAERPGADGEADARRRGLRDQGRPPLAGEGEDPARPRRAADDDRLREGRGARARVRAAEREGQRRRRDHEHGRRSSTSPRAAPARRCAGRRT